MRYDIAFFLCCCRSFLSSKNGDSDESYYDLLAVSRDASPEELRRAYKKASLQMHPDKLTQQGRTVTAEDRDRFTRMRSAYEVLADPRRRETYDAIGERGMKMVEEPLSVDPQELAHNFATSSILDRSKIFAIFLSIYIAVFLLPVMICLMADNTFGPDAMWAAVLTPLWLWDVFILFYHVRVLMMGPIKRPDHIPEEEWIDPLPMRRRVTALVRFSFLVLFQVLLTLQLDGVINIMWSVLFIPMYIWDLIALRRKVMLANISIVTAAELELAIGKKMADCSPEEKEDLHRRFIVVPAKSGHIYDSAQRLKDDASMDIIRILARIIFSVLLVVNLDLGNDWSYWLISIPIFAMSLCICGSAFNSLSRVQAEVVQKDPTLFGLDPTYAQMDDEEKGAPSPLTDEEKEELKAKVAHSAYRAFGTFFSQCFFAVLVCFVIGKIEGAGYPTLVIISPFLVAGGVILCCLGCTIFCLSEVDENAGMAQFETSVAAAGSGYTPPRQKEQAHAQPHQTSTDGNEVDENATGDNDNGQSKPPSSTWDPENGEIWANTTMEEEECSDSAKEQEMKDLTSAPETNAPHQGTAESEIPQKEISEVSPSYDLD